jgi:lysine-ketoglutarate reductase/saccharopine dehydrogenase-like protein (TIGR00300 family)
LFLDSGVHASDLGFQSADFVLEFEDALDAGDVDAGVGQGGYLAQLFYVATAVEPGAASGAIRVHQAFAFVDRILDVDVGRTRTDSSRARFEVGAPDEAALSALLDDLQVYGVNRLDTDDVASVVTDKDGVFPEGFYSTTNLPTSVRWPASGGGSRMRRWTAVWSFSPTAWCGPCPCIGSAVVVGHRGVRVEAPSRAQGAVAFEFMRSEVSSEKAKAVLIAEMAERIRQTKATGSKVLVVCGPALVHTGSGPYMARLVRDGWVDVLFAGNGFATHDLESTVFGTSLGVSVREGSPVGGHANHLWVVNEIRRYGSVAAAAEAGFVTGGVMYECARRDVLFCWRGRSGTTGLCLMCSPTWSGRLTPCATFWAGYMSL